MNFSHRHRRRGISEINLTPLLDVVFNLLIFFLITTTFVQNPGIEVDLPKASDVPDTRAGENVIVAITREGRFIHEGRAVSAGELKARLTEHFKARATATVIIQGDENTPHGRVVEVMDIARHVGFAALAIATEAP